MCMGRNSLNIQDLTRNLYYKDGMILLGNATMYVTPKNPGGKSSEFGISFFVTFLPIVASS